MFATIAMGWRASWFTDLDAAISHACFMLGVDAVEEIGVGIVWVKLRTGA
jgi:hypothetical protein